MGDSNSQEIPEPHFDVTVDEELRELYKDIEAGIFDNPGLYIEVLDLYEASIDPERSSVDAFVEAFKYINTERVSSRKFSNAFDNIVSLFRNRDSIANLLFDDDTEAAIESDDRLIILRDMVKSTKPNENDRVKQSRKVRNQIGRVSFFISRVASTHQVETDQISSQIVEETA